MASASSDASLQERALLFLIPFAIIEFGLVLGRGQTVTIAAFEGAREAIVFRVFGVTGMLLLSGLRRRPPDPRQHR